mmetsp:Transcript_11899/g.47956  ORF Transcript_11899/g.47956 Transcript_11899/m.47956 type:complete len:571 (-) Transcript_11899:1183-2895(-)
MECVVEYAKSDRGSCKGCSSPMRKHSVKVGKEIQSPFHDGTMTLFYHPKCFFDATFLTDVRLLKKLSSLKWKDQVMLERLLAAAAEKYALPDDASSLQESVSMKTEKAVAESSGSSRKRKREATEEGLSGRKRKRTESTACPSQGHSRGAMKAVTDQWWRIRKLVDGLTRDEITTLLKHNGMAFADAKLELLVLQCTHMLVHGVPERCASCQDPLVYKFGRNWSCSGSTEWAKCPFTVPTEDVSVSTFKIPKAAKWDPFREAIQEPVRPVSRELSDAEAEAIPPPMSVRERLAVIKDHANKGKPLYGCVLACVGKLFMTQKATKELVERLGGRVSSTITDKLTHCVSTHEILSKQNSTNQKLQKALDLSLPIYSEKLLEHIAEEEALPTDRNSYLLDGNTSPEERQKKKEKVAAQRAADDDASTATATFTVKGKGAVDPQSGLQDKGHVFVSKSDNVYAATLAATDITRGTNSYYVMQVVQRTSRATGSGCGEDGAGQAPTLATTSSLSSTAPQLRRRSSSGCSWTRLAMSGRLGPCSRRRRASSTSWRRSTTQQRSSKMARSWRRCRST